MPQRVTVGGPTPAQGSRPATATRRDRYPIPPIRGRSSARFTWVLALTVLVWAAAWPFVTLAFINRYDSPGTAWIQALYDRKDLALSRAASPHMGRLVVIGGSGTLLGIDAELIQLKLGVPTVNLGTHAGLNAYILYRARSVLRRGDSALLCPEYELWSERADDISDVEWAYVTTHDKSFLWSLGDRRALRILYSEPAKNYFDALHGWRSRLTGKSNESRAGYNVAVMGPNGDLRLDVPHQSFAKLGRFPFPDFEIDPDAGQSIRAFALWARDNGVRVFYSWPNCCVPDPTPLPAAVVPPAAVGSFLKNLGVIVLNAPIETAFPRQWFTDSVYHADGGCRRIRTEDLIRKLRPYYGQPIPRVTIHGILLVGGGVNQPREGNAFADGPGVRVKYLSRERLNHPDAITPADLPALVEQGIEIWFDDPSIQPLLSEKDWDMQEVDRDRSSLAGWFKKYDHHLFVLGFTGGQAQSDVAALRSDLPPDLRPALTEPGLTVAIVGTGPWRKIHHVVTGPNSILIRTDLNSLVGDKVPNLSIITGGSAGNGKPWSRIRLDNRLYVEGGAGEISVAVIDPDNGVMVDSATFTGGQEKTFWWLRRLVLRSSQAATNMAAGASTRPARAD